MLPPETRGHWSQSFWKTSGSCRLCLRSMPGEPDVHMPTALSASPRSLHTPGSPDVAPEPRPRGNLRHRNVGAHRVHLSCGCGRGELGSEHWQHPPHKAFWRSGVRGEVLIWALAQIRCPRIQNQGMKTVTGLHMQVAQRVNASTKCQCTKRRFPLNLVKENLLTKAPAENCIISTSVNQT